MNTRSDEPNGGKVLSQITTDFEHQQVDAVCGIVVACSDHPSHPGGIGAGVHYVLLNTRKGETEIPHDRRVTLLRGLADNLRLMAADMDRTAAELELPPSEAN